LLQLWGASCQGCKHRRRHPLSVTEDDSPCWECFVIWFDSDDGVRPFWEPEPEPIWFEDIVFSGTRSSSQ